MLFNNFLIDLNLNFLKICSSIVLTKSRLCIITENQRFNFLIKICQISWLALYFCIHIYIYIYIYILYIYIYRKKESTRKKSFRKRQYVET